MALSPNPTEVRLHPVLAWLHRQVEPVPPNLAVCEFDCRRSQCRYRDWEACDRVHHVHPSRSLPLATLTHRPPTAPTSYTDA